MSGQGVVGDGSRLFAQHQVGLAHLEEDLDVPALAISLDDLFFGQCQVRRGRLSMRPAVAAASTTRTTGSG